MLYILFTFLLIKKNIVKQRRKNTKSSKKRMKKIFFFFYCSKSFLLVKSFIDVKPRIINSSFEIQTQGNWDRSNAVILVERRPYSTYKDLELSTVAAVTRKESE